MIDFQVAWDKLAGFQNATDLAEYLLSEGVQGDRSDARSCAIGQWMTDTTGETYLVYGGFYAEDTSPMDRVTGHVKPIATLTPAMSDFIVAFDRGDYPELVTHVGELK